MARVSVREQEAYASFQLIETALAHLPEGPCSVASDEFPVGESSFSLAESPRGATCHWVLLGPDQTIARYRIRTASYANWPVVVRAALGNMVPDFPLINKSFELCYSCLDR
jgi:Ni,Fe-hydrogenase III large subunit